MYPSLNIIIVNWNSGKYLNECIKSIEESSTSGIELHIIVIDNASTDDSLKSIVDIPNLTIIRNSKNLGFAKACNQGINYKKSTYILFLNPDTRLKKDTLLNCVNLIKKQTDIDILGVKHLDENENTSLSCSRFPTLLSFFNDIFGLSKISPRFFKSATLMTDWDHNNSKYVDQVMGAFMFTKRDIFNKIEPFNEKFFVYFEDLDLSYRLKKTGGKIFYSSEIEIFHRGGGTSNQVIAKRLFYLLRSRIIYGKIHFTQIESIILTLITLVIEPFTRVLYLLIHGELKNIVELSKTYKYLFSYLFRKKRLDASLTVD